MSTYKLFYFNMRGFAEVNRIIFAQAGVKYEDVRFEWGRQWVKEYQQSMPFLLVPVLEVDGTKIAGTFNILRYLGRKFGMAGKDDLADAVLGGASDFMADITAKMNHWAEFDQQEKSFKELKEKTFPQMLGTLQKNVTNGHINGSETLSWVDIQCYQLLDNLNTHFGINLADYPELKKVYDGVVAEPNIRKWLKERPKTYH